MEDRELIERLLDVIERNTGAMERVTNAVEANAKMIEANAEKNEELAKNMKRMTATIQATQKKIGGEMGAVIERQKATAAALKVEADAVVLSQRGGTP